MEKQTTAMQTLISEIKQLQSQPYINPKNALNDCLLLAMGNLKLERQQIEEAYLQGFCEYNIASMDFEQYFNQTFK